MAQILERRTETLPFLSPSSYGKSSVDGIFERSFPAGWITFNYPMLSVTDRGIIRQAASSLAQVQTDTPIQRVIFVDQPANATRIPQAHEIVNRELDWVVKNVAGLPNNTYESVLGRAFTDFLTRGDLQGSLMVYDPHKNTQYDIYEHFGPLLRSKVFSLLAVATKRNFPDKVLDNSIRCALQAVEYLKQAGLEKTAGDFERGLKREYFKANFWKDLTPFSTAPPSYQNGHHEQNGRFIR